MLGKFVSNEEANINRGEDKKERLKKPPKYSPKRG